MQKVGAQKGLHQGTFCDVATSYLEQICKSSVIDIGILEHWCIISVFQHNYPYILIGFLHSIHFITYWSILEHKNQLRIKICISGQPKNIVNLLLVPVWKFFKKVLQLIFTPFSWDLKVKKFMDASVLLCKTLEDCSSYQNDTMSSPTVYSSSTYNLNFSFQVFEPSHLRTMQSTFFTLDLETWHHKTFIENNKRKFRPFFLVRYFMTAL